MRSFASAAAARAIATGSFLVLSAIATQSVAEGVHGRWESRSTDGKCWAASQPVGATGNAGGRGPAYVSIQNHPSEGVRGSIAVVSGNPDSGKGEVTLEVDGSKFDVLPYGDAAFSRSGAPEASLIAAMRKGRELKVTWALPSGDTVVDTYSMEGFASAKSEIDQKCR